MSEDSVPPAIQVQLGVTSAEQYLHALCRRSFLSLWNYPAVYRSQGVKNGGDGKEVCDLLVVFGDDVLIFSDKDCAFPSSGNLDVDWSRWFRKAVRDSAGQIYGAERWLRTFPDKLFLDRACTRPLPLVLPPSDRIRFHRIVVAHNVVQRSQDTFKRNGGLQLFSGLKGNAHFQGATLGEPADYLEGLRESFKANFGIDGQRLPFVVGDIDPNKGFVHVLDDVSLEIVLSSRDTIADFVEYLTKREQLFRSGRIFLASSEQDLLAIYLMSRSDEQNELNFDFGGAASNVIVEIPPGEYEHFISRPECVARDTANQSSYWWDGLIEEFNSHILGGTSPAYPETPLSQQELAVRALARENRFSRRMLSDSFGEFFLKDQPSQICVRVIPPIFKDSPFYVFLTISREGHDDYSQYRELRRGYMVRYSQSVKVKFPHATRVVVIATEPRRDGETRSTDLLLADVTHLTEQQIADVGRLQAGGKFLADVTPSSSRTISEYPESP